LELDFIRGAAALIVAVYHWLGNWYEYSETAMIIFRGAPFAVDIFFILSGFVMSYAYGKKIEDRQIGLRSFAMLRIGRLYPMILVSSILAVTAFWIVNNRFITPDISIADSIFMNAFLLQGISGKFDGFIGVFWSVGIEFWVGLTLFYGVSRYKAYFINFLIVLALLFFAYGGKNSLFFGFDIGLINENIRRGLLGIGLGVICYRIYSGHKETMPYGWRKSALESAFYLLFILTLFYMIAPQQYTIGVNKIFVEILVCAMILLGATLKNRCRLCCAKWQSWLGDMSYSVYILHMFIVWLATRLIRPLDIGLNISAAIGTVFVVIATLAIAYCSHKYIEKPAYRWLRTLIGQ
jgi:peptidoglycan/LPS O-acetylase OafA/YrhL